MLGLVQIVRAAAQFEILDGNKTLTGWDASVLLGFPHLNKRDPSISTGQIGQYWATFG